MKNYQNLVPRFIKYVKTETRSDETSTTVPSTHTQVEFAQDLAKELKDIGMQDVRISPESAYVLATLPSNLDDDTDVKKVGFIAHIDTADFNAVGVAPQIIENYDGVSEIKLGDSGYSLSPAEFASLKKYQGQDLITTDGTTLLGADDKAGVAEVMTAMEYLIQHPEIKHGEVKIGFGPDEEIGKGATHFEVDDFGADFAYTVDGGPLGELQYETFNAAQAEVKFIGKNVHPGSAKDIMVNAIKLAMEFDSMLPADEVPEKTDGREGFFLGFAIEGNVDAAKMTYIIRDHDREKFEARKAFLQQIAQQMNEKYGVERVIVELEDQYYNMAEVIQKDMTVVDIAEEAMKNVDVQPDIFPVRGGTDGSMISFMGLPTPNLFAGGENMHARFEYVSVQTMEKATDVIIEIIKLVATK